MTNAYFLANVTLSDLAWWKRGSRYLDHHDDDILCNGPGTYFTRA